MTDLIESVIQRIAVGPDRGRDIERHEARQVMQAILAGRVDPVQTAVILIALRMKRESVDEMIGLFEGLQSGVSITEVKVDQLFCLADPFDGYVRCLPMTPFLPAVLAACGHQVCLTGVQTVGPKFGVTAHQVYRLAGINCDLGVADCAKQIEGHGWAYLDQAQVLPALHALADFRGQIIKRTAVTTLERLLNPLRAQGQTHAVLGFVHKAFPEIYAAVAAEAGYNSILLSKGVEGGLAPATNKPLRQHFLDCLGPNKQLESRVIELPEQLNPNSSAHMVDRGDQATAEQTLELGLKVLNGEPGAARDSLVLSAAHVLSVYQADLDLHSAVEKVGQCLDNGKALSCFDVLRDFS